MPIYDIYGHTLSDRTVRKVSTAFARDPESAMTFAEQTLNAIGMWARGIEYIHIDAAYLQEDEYLKQFPGKIGDDF